VALAFGGGLAVGAAAALLVMALLAGGRTGGTSGTGTEPQARPGVATPPPFQAPALAMPNYVSGYSPNEPWNLAIVGPAIGASLAAGTPAAEAGAILQGGR
jgi:hypothetical protein